MDDSGEGKKKFGVGSIAFWIAILAVVAYFVAPKIINPPADPYRDGLKDPESALRLYQNTAYRFTKNQEGVGFMEMEKVVPESDWAWYEANYSSLDKYDFAGGLHDEVISGLDPTIGAAIDKRIGLTMLIESGCYEPSSEIMSKEIGPTEATFVCRTKTLETKSVTDWKVKVLFDGKYWKVVGFALGQANLTGGTAKGDIVVSEWDLEAEKRARVEADMGGISPAEFAAKEKAASAPAPKEEESGNPLDLLGAAPAESEESGNPLDALASGEGEESAEPETTAETASEEDAAPSTSAKPKPAPREVASSATSDKYSSLDGLKITDPKDPFGRQNGKSKAATNKVAEGKDSSDPLAALASASEATETAESEPASAEVNSTDEEMESPFAAASKSTSKGAPTKESSVKTDAAASDESPSLMDIVADDSASEVTDEKDGDTIAAAESNDADPFGLGFSEDDAAGPSEAADDSTAPERGKLDRETVGQMFADALKKNGNSLTPAKKGAGAPAPPKPAAAQSKTVAKAEPEDAEGESVWGNLDSPEESDAEKVPTASAEPKEETESAEDDPFGDDSDSAKPAAAAKSATAPKSAPAEKPAPAKPAPKPSAKSDPGAILGGPPAKVDPALLAPADALLNQAAKDWNAGKFKQSVASAEKALAIYRRNLGEDHPKIAKVKKMIEDAKAKAGE